MTAHLPNLKMQPITTLSMRFAAVILILSSLLLSGCISTMPSADTTPPSTILSWQTRQAELNQFDHWQLKARVASADNVIGFSGELNWAQRQQVFDIQGSGPLGIGAFRVKGTPSQVTITTKEGTFVSYHPNADMQRQFGWRLPLEALQYWVLGLPWQDDFSSQRVVSPPEVMDFDPYGRLMQLTQAGWTITYLEYQQQDFLGFDLPTRLLIEDPNLDYKVKMLIANWQVIPVAIPQAPPQTSPQGTPPLPRPMMPPLPTPSS